MDASLFLACERGTAVSLKRELARKGFADKQTTTTPTTVVVHGCTKEELVRAAYTLQTPTRIGYLLGTANITLDTEETVLALETLIGSLDLHELLIQDKTFLVVCDRDGNHEYNSVDLSQAAGRLLRRYAKEALPFVPDVDLKRPDILFHLHVDDDQAWFSLDLLGYDADKRHYKLFNNPHSIKGAAAACLLMAADWQPGMSLLDPFAGGGEIPIEAALFSTKRSPHYYEKKLACKHHPLFAPLFAQVTERADGAVAVLEQGVISSYDAQLRNVSAAKKNAKIAGVDKSISFSKLDVEWLDTKLQAGSIDRIVTLPVEASKHIPRDKALTLHKQLFYQADFVLHKQGTITFLCTKPEDLLLAAEHYGFAVVEQRQVFTGKLPRWVARFSKQQSQTKSP